MCAKRTSPPHTNGKGRQRRVGRDINAIHIGDFGPQKLVAPPQIRFVEPTVRFTKRIQVTLPVGSLSLVVTPSLLAAGLPGGLTYWNNIRFERFDLYGDQASSLSEAGTLSVNLTPSSDWSQPAFELRSEGTVGNVRPSLAFRFGILDRARFFGTADTTNLFQILAPEGTIVTLQATVEVISPTLPD